MRRIPLSDSAERSERSPRRDAGTRPEEPPRIMNDDKDASRLAAALHGFREPEVRPMAKNRERPHEEREGSRR